MQVTLQYAQEHLSELVAAADSGQDVQITRSEKPAIKLFLVESGEDADPRSSKCIGRKHLLGAWEGKVVLPTDEEWRAMDEEIANEMLDGPIFPPERM